MYLSGKKYYTSYGDNTKRVEEGHSVEEVIVRLGYWRKHANLHGYIVRTFADGIDECQDIELTMDNLKHLLETVKEPTRMEKTEGFFFGESDNSDEQIKEDVAYIEKAIAFLVAGAMTKEKGVWRSVHYRASW